ncbi:collagenase-like [Bradysia coprophila]|uniref:collagenase-like n=1 Tax=Bradysia coprophila TaxID=38358 RepID=UPI00187D808E|nr:collagenase-like [Bradysia coprophila]
MISKVMFVIFLQALIYSRGSVEASPVTRIIDGSIAHHHQFPWHLSLQIVTSTSTNIRYCGGSLISNQFVLTAASCLVDATNVRIDMGSVLFLEPQFSQESTQFVSHSQFNGQFNTNNIGIIRLRSPISEYSNTLRAILIPGTQHAGDQYVGVQSYISGYGVYVLGGNVLSNQLKFGQQTTLANVECQQSFDARFVQAGSICAKSNATQTVCHGDIGGPLVVQYGDTWMQIGIASTISANGCAGPTVYTRLTSYIDWIRTMTGISNDHV